MSARSLWQTLTVVGSAAILAAATACGGGGAPAPAAGDTASSAAPTTESAPPAAEPTAPSAPAAPAPRRSAESTAAQPAPAPEPPPEPVVATVPSGTAFDVVFLDGLSSESSQAGDSFRARVKNDVVQDGIPVIPAGSTVVGTVLEAVPLKKIGGRAKLSLEFNRLELPSGRTAVIEATFAAEGKSETKKDAATIGGAAAGGAVLGRLIDKKHKDKGTLIGAIVGAAAGTAIAAKTEGEKVELPAGTELTLELQAPATITVRP